MRCMHAPPGWCAGAVSARCLLPLLHALPVPIMQTTCGPQAECAHDRARVISARPVRIGAVLAGYVFGFGQALGPIIVSELFGLAHYATNAAFVNTTFIASSFGIAATLTNWSYQQGKHGSGERACNGKQCFGVAFIICAIIGGFTMAASVALTLRRRKYYKRMFRCADQ